MPHEIFTIKQISDFLHVDLHIRHFDSEFNIARRIIDTGEDLFNDTGNDTLCILVVDISTLHKLS